MNTFARNLIRRLTRRARLCIISADITRVNVDAIVNAAKPSLLGGGGVDGAIHAKGGPSILAECKRIRNTVYPNGLPLGRAVVTGAGDLLADYVIHTVGPDARLGETDPDTLAACYRACLKAADGLKVRTLAFPLISSGAYGWAREEALSVALAAILSTRTRVRTVTLVLYEPSDVRLAETILFERGIRL